MKTIFNRNRQIQKQPEVLMEFPKDDKLIALINTPPSSNWSSGLKAWLIPNSDDIISSLSSILQGKSWLDYSYLKEVDQSQLPPLEVDPIAIERLSSPRLLHKRSLMKRITVLITLLLITGNVFPQDSVKTNNDAVITWIQQKAIPITQIEAGNDFLDLQPLQQILKDVRVVGLGENTHGTREFFQVKHRLLKFLVQEMGFTAFALEAGYGACEPINNYVLYGEGDLPTVLTAQGYVVWDMEELATMIEWMRTYNQTVPDDKKVAFYGIDFMYNEAAREKVLDYLKKYDPQMAPGADSLFQFLSIQEKQWSKEKDKDLLTDARYKLQDLITYLTEQQNKLTATSSASEFGQTLRYSQVMEQWFMLYLPDPSDSLSTTAMKRSKAMGENLIYLMEKDKPNTKFVMWQHNVHIGDGHMETAEPNLGNVLKKKLGDAYFAIAFEFNQGSYQSRLRPPGTAWNQLREASVTAAPKGYLAYYLSQAKKGNLFWNLRDTADNQTIKQWLSQPQVMRYFGWFNDDVSIKKVDLISRYDGILFIEQTTATRPTKNALATVSKGEGL